MKQPLSHFLLGVVLIIALALSGCGAHRGTTALPPPQSEPIAAVPPATQPVSKLDSVVVQPRRTILDKVLGRNPKPYVTDSHVGDIGKKSTVSIYYGPATVTTTTVGKKAVAATAEGATVTAIGKVKAPTAVGDSAVATDNTKAGQRGGAAAIGAGSTATATTVKPPTPWLKYGLWAAGALGAYWLLFGGGAALLLALWRRNKSTDTTV